MLSRLHIRGYRSIRDIDLGLRGLEVLVGPNGCGKSNLYRALRLFAAAAGGRLARTLADEGGLPSALSATEKPPPSTSIVLGCQMDEWSYELDIALPAMSPSERARTAFGLDPVVRSERLALHSSNGRPKVFLQREGKRTTMLGEDGRRQDYPHDLLASESALGQLNDPRQFPELAALRAQILDWRFYHQFRTDESSPLRRPQVGVFTPILAHDGIDLAAALQSIREHTPGSPGEQELDQWIERAFPGSQLTIPTTQKAMFEVLLQVPGMKRPLQATELSDGTLRFLCLLAALSSPRPSRLLVLNEPETSLHPDVLPILADLIAAAAKHSQILLTTHSASLANAIRGTTTQPPTELHLTDGATRVVGRGRYE